MLRVSSICGGVIAAALVGACAPAKDAPWLTATSPEQHTDRFPITTGEHAGMDCNRCHGDFDTFREFSCVTCHDHAQEVTDPQHEGIPGYVFERRSCYQCHPTGDKAAVDFHQDLFPIGPSSTHPEQVCADCHLDVTDATVVTCIDCHSHEETPMAETHQAVDDYRWETAACLSCHPTGVGVDREGHAPLFPIADGTKHQETECNECHTNPSDQRDVACIECHEHERGDTDGEHSEVGNYSYSSSGCLRCHYDSSVPRIGDHLPFRVDRNSKHRARNSGCLECHPSFQAEKTFAADFTDFSCAPCHSRSEMDGQHGNRPGYAYDFPTCVQSGCHPDGRKDD